MTIRRALHNIYWKIEAIIAPGLQYSQSIYEETLRALVGPHTTWLDLGCGHQILPPWRSEQEAKIAGIPAIVVGVDYSLSSLSKHRNISYRVKGDITKLPFKDCSFDLATANMVLEHLERPDVQFKEIARVLKPGGMFLFHTPNVLGYSAIGARAIPDFARRKLVRFLEGRGEEDVFPTYYRANSKRRIEHLAQGSGFSVTNMRMIVSSAALIAIPPLVVLELAWIRLLMTKALRPLRTNIITTLKKVRDSRSGARSNHPS
jgi:ubiquinone/menaquinone biosynthesis C-methylase UbiE